MNKDFSVRSRLRKLRNLKRDKMRNNCRLQRCSGSKKDKCRYRKGLPRKALNPKSKLSRMYSRFQSQHKVKLCKHGALQSTMYTRIKMGDLIGKIYCVFMHLYVNFHAASLLLVVIEGFIFSSNLLLKISISHWHWLF